MYFGFWAQTRVTVPKPIFEAAGNPCTHSRKGMCLCVLDSSTTAVMHMVELRGDVYIRAHSHVALVDLYGNIVKHSCQAYECNQGQDVQSQATRGVGGC